MTVYAVQEPCTFTNGKWVPRVNIYKAASFGDVAVLVPPHEVHAAMVTQPTIRRLRRDLRNFSDDDFLLPVGDIVLVAMATAIAAEANRGRVKLLRWSRERKEYDVVEMRLYGDVDA